MRRLVALVVTIVILGTLTVLQRDALADTWNRLTEIHPLAFIPLVIAACLMILARAAFLASCSPGITIRQAILTDQSALAAGYGIFLGGAAVGTGMRIHMFRNFGLRPLQISSSIVATAVVPSFTTWGLPIAVLFIPTVRGTATDVQQLVVIVGITLLVFSAMFWWGALESKKVFVIVGRLGEFMRTTLLRRLPKRFQRVRSMIEALRPQSFSSEMRTALRQLIRLRWLKIIASSVGTLSTGFLCLWTSASVFGVQGLEFREALVAFSLIRVLIALSPIPGATGIAEVGLVALLERAGVSLVDATGATILYRLLTWLIPILVGTSCWWLYSHSTMMNSSAISDVKSESAVDQMGSIKP